MSLKTTRNRHFVSVDGQLCAALGQRERLRQRGAFYQGVFRHGKVASTSKDNGMTHPSHDEFVAFLQEDLQHLFDDQGIDVTKYEDTVQFEDPITRHTSIQGYIQNIQFLKRVFNPIFILRDIQRTHEYEVAFRWTMHMTPSVPFLGALTFTGTSRLGISPETGKFKSHIDTWDAIKNQKYFSFEAFVHMLGQLLAGQEYDPSYNVLVKRHEYELREYADGSVTCVFTKKAAQNIDSDDWIHRIIDRDGLRGYVRSDGSIDRVNDTLINVPLQSFSLHDYLPLEAQ